MINGTTFTDREPISHAQAKPLADAVLRRVLTARYLFRRAEDQATQGQDVPALVAVNLLQDAVEMFLLAAAAHLHTPIGRRDDFDKIIEKVDAALDQPLNFRARLLDLNHARVGSKHRGLLPNRTELAGLVAVVREYFSDSCSRVFNQSFWTIAVSDGIARPDVRAHVQAAERAYIRQDYETAIIEIRKAFFIVFESRYDINKHNCAAYFSSAPEPAPFLLSPRLVPEWLEEHRIKEVFDYIYFDEAHLSESLRRDKIDPDIFESILSSTPSVYCLAPDHWTVRRSDTLYAASDIVERTAYALEHVPEMILRRQARETAVRSPVIGTTLYIRFKRPDVPLYLRATRDSQVLPHILSPGFEPLCWAEVPSFDGRETFYAFVPPGAIECLYVNSADADLLNRHTDEENGA